VTATAGPGPATVNWSPSASDGGSAITRYDVTSYVNGVAQGVTHAGGATRVTVNGLTNGTTYTFRVSATNLLGTGALSAASNPVTPGAAPAAPQLLAASPRDRRLETP